MYDFNDIRESVGKKIKEKRLSYDFTQEQLAEKLGVSKGSISSWEKGRTAPRMDKVSQMAEIFNVPWSYFVSGNDETPPLPPEAITNIGAQTQRIPVYGSISAGTPIEAIENLTETTVPDQLIERYGKDNLFGLLVRGDSMDKVIHDGHYAILCKTDHVESGDIAAVTVNGYEATLKRVFKLDRGVLLEPASHNPEYLPAMYLDEQADEVQVIGKMVHIMLPIDFKF